MSNEKQYVAIANGAGVPPVQVEWQEGMTYSQAIAAANITLSDGEVPVVGDTRIKNPDTDLVKPGSLIVIDQAASNG